MNERLIPDRSAEPALQESLDHGPISTTAVHSEDAVRDADQKDAEAAAEEQAEAAPDVSSDRVLATDAEPEGSLDCVRSAALGIQQIENLENDAKGG